MIKFHYQEKKEVKPTFGDVEVSQFFIYAGGLYQKVGDHKANMIADSNGTPCAMIMSRWVAGEMIDEILPHVHKITWR